jgi:hypothetical protein
MSKSVPKISASTLEDFGHRRNRVLVRQSKSNPRSGS